FPVPVSPHMWTDNSESTTRTMSAKRPCMAGPWPISSGKKTPSGGAARPARAIVSVKEAPFFDPPPHPPHVGGGSCGGHERLIFWVAARGVGERAKTTRRCVSARPRLSHKERCHNDARRAHPKSPPGFPAPAALR